MKNIGPGRRAWRLVLAGLFLALAVGCARAPPPLERYRKLEFPPTAENFDRGWKERVALEYEIINGGDLESLRAALVDESPFVRSMAARTLGILGDRASADALAGLVTTDPEYMVRIRAVESLGLLKMKREAIELARKDRDLGVQWAADRAAGQLESKTVDRPGGEVRRRPADPGGAHGLTPDPGREGLPDVRREVGGREAGGGSVRGPGDGPPPDQGIQGAEPAPLEGRWPILEGEGPGLRHRTLGPGGIRLRALRGLEECLRWGSWVENRPTWFVIDREGTITYTAQPAFSTPTSYVEDIHLLLEALRKAK